LWLVAAFLGVASSGCATITGHITQTVQIEALDGHDRPVAGFDCSVSNATGSASAVTAAAPATEVEVRRSSSELQVECRRGTQVATATVEPRRSGLEQALLPFGSVGVFVDHVTGTLYAYPSPLRLRIGQHLVLEHGEEARVVKSEALARPAGSIGLAQAVVDLPAAPEVVALPASAPKVASAAAAPRIKVAQSTAMHATVRPAVSTAAATASAVPAVHRTAPVNW
jgi:hypothetical protein